MPEQWSHDQLLVGGRGAASGWTVSWQEVEVEGTAAAGLMRLDRAGRAVTALFADDGLFLRGQDAAPGGTGRELDLDGVLRELTADAVHGPEPTETPAAEGSTTAGISVPEPPEVRRAWGPWPLVLIALLVACVVVFMVARIFAW